MSKPADRRRQSGEYMTDWQHHPRYQELLAYALEQTSDLAEAREAVRVALGSGLVPLAPPPVPAPDPGVVAALSMVEDLLRSERADEVLAQGRRVVQAMIEEGPLRG